MAVTGGPPSKASEAAVGPTRLALLIGIVLAAQDNTNRPLGVVILLALAVLLGLSLQWDLGLVVIAALAVAGVAMRLDLLHAGTSDVLTVTRSAIQTVLAGGNPYGIGYATSSPPGAPFPYGPLALAWYVPFQGDPRVVETAVSFLVLLLLAVRGRPLGLAVYALALPLILTCQRRLQRHQRRAPPAGGARRAAAQPARRRRAAGARDRIQAVCRRLVHPPHLVGARGRDASASSP